jgi:hypothetical protein
MDFPLDVSQVQKNHKRLDRGTSPHVEKVDDQDVWVDGVSDESGEALWV